MGDVESGVMTCWYCGNDRPLKIPRDSVHCHEQANAAKELGILRAEKKRADAFLKRHDGASFEDLDVTLSTYDEIHDALEEKFGGYIEYDDGLHFNAFEVIETVSEAFVEARAELAEKEREFKRRGIALVAMDAECSRVKRELAAAKERVRDEVERECITAICQFCATGQVPFRECGYWYHRWQTPTIPITVMCKCVRIYERRYQRGSEAGAGSE